MKNVTYSTFRSELSSTLNRVAEDHTPILITRRSGKDAVVMSLEDFRSYEETAYLMSSAKNAQRINESIDELEAKKGKARKLIDE